MIRRQGWAWALVIMAMPAMADVCRMQERTVTQHRVTIEERSSVSRDVISMPGGGRKCMVSFRVRIGSQWHTAHGEHIWDGNLGSNEACAQATTRAEDLVRERVGRGASLTERVLICDDRPDLQELRGSVTGTVARNHQFRPHPDYPQRFWHRGAECRWFLEPTLTDRGLHNFQGIICELGRDQWVVVDRF